MTRRCSSKSNSREQHGHLPSLPEDIPVCTAQHTIHLRQPYPQQRQIIAFVSLSMALTNRKLAVQRPRGNPIQPAAPEPPLALFQA